MTREHGPAVSSAKVGLQPSTVFDSFERSASIQAIGANISTSLGEVAATMDSFDSPKLDAAASDVPVCQDAAA